MVLKNSLVKEFHGIFISGATTDKAYDPLMAALWEHLRIFITSARIKKSIPSCLQIHTSIREDWTTNLPTCYRKAIQTHKEVEQLRFDTFF